MVSLSESRIYLECSWQSFNSVEVYIDLSCSVFSYFVFKAHLIAATYRTANGCAPPSPALSFWSWSVNSHPTCTCRVYAGSKSPRISTCQRSRWKYGSKTAALSTRKKEKARKGARTQDANARAATRTIRALKMKNPSHLSQPQKRKRLHLSRGDPSIRHSGTLHRTLKCRIQFMHHFVTLRYGGLHFSNCLTVALKIF